MTPLISTALNTPKAPRALPFIATSLKDGQRSFTADSVSGHNFLDLFRDKGIASKKVPVTTQNVTDKSQKPEPFITAIRVYGVLPVFAVLIFNTALKPRPLPVLKARPMASEIRPRGDSGVCNSDDSLTLRPFTSAIPKANVRPGISHSRMRTLRRIMRSIKSSLHASPVFKAVLPLNSLSDFTRLRKTHSVRHMKTLNNASISANHIFNGIMIAWTRPSIEDEVKRLKKRPISEHDPAKKTIRVSTHNNKKGHL